MKRFPLVALLIPWVLSTVSSRQKAEHLFYYVDSEES